ncbi:MAG: protein kinase domain-containing protein, partial [Blastocatellia bacterium]
MERRAGKVIGHYRILSTLGSGGMSDVYLAEDVRLGRRVALKVPPESVQHDVEERARFLREARIAAALRTPNAAAIYDVGEEGGASYIAMEYVEGESVSGRLERLGPIPAREAIDIAIQVCRALDEAHSMGIIHRDIKSANLMVDKRGLVKVLDFGIAKVVERNTGGVEGLGSVAYATDTGPGMIIGTVSYMSPEQSRGLKLDARADIFSLGVVLYEILTDRLPFVGETPTDILVSILQKDPPPLVTYVEWVPGDLARIVVKALAKDKELRYQSVREMAADLSRLQTRLKSESLTLEPNTTAPPAFESQVTGRFGEVEILPSLSGKVSTSARYLIAGLRRRRGAALAVITLLLVLLGGISFLKPGGAERYDSIAVLPFLNGGGGPDTEYLSEGIAESIINTLSRAPDLTVKSYASVLRYKVTGADAEFPDLQAASEQLGVHAVLTGRVTQRGDNLAISVELVDPRHNSHIWGAIYNRKMADIFTVEEEISREVSDNLKLRLSGTDRERMARHETENTTAYQLYLKGRYCWNKRTEDGIRKSIDYYQQAIAADPNYALAYAGLADSYNLFGSYGLQSEGEFFPEAESAVKKALVLDDSLAEAHSALAYIRDFRDWDWRAAEGEYERAIELDPNYATGHHWYGMFLLRRGRISEAILEIKRALELDPLSLIINANLGMCYHYAGQYDAAIEQFRKTLDMDQNFSVAHSY